ncbi:hypothetical protein ACFLXJ_03440 [Chloroflexota bacterium]
MISMNKATKISVVAISLIAITLLVSLFVFQPSAETQSEALALDSCPTPKEIATMDFTDKSTIPNDASIPPIDASAPAITETATFALG